MTPVQKNAFEVWVLPILGGKPDWRESTEFELAFKAWEAASAVHPDPLGEEARQIDMAGEYAAAEQTYGKRIRRVSERNDRDLGMYKMGWWDRAWKAAPVVRPKAEKENSAEFLSVRLARVAELVGVSMPSTLTHEQIAEVAGTILGDIAFRLKHQQRLAAHYQTIKPAAALISLSASQQAELK